MAKVLEVRQQEVAKTERDEQRSEAELLDDMLNERDRRGENWDVGARIAACEAAIQRGVRIDILRKIYGEELVAALAAANKENP